ncbi:uncharacterized protein [Elaeis guineensis]|uniref:uncharacterized protein n=1 Tax=Elaeis guineensis var. tenera TaxID=51953 RepID=UPI003C6CE57B
MAKNKLSRADRFPMSFFQSYWDILREDLIGAINVIQHKKTDVSRFNYSHMVLIPKTAELATITDFKPIYLEHAVIKIFSKILAKTLSNIIDKLVSSSQNAFIRRSVLEHRGFGKRWVSWIASILHNSHSALIINGRVGNWFSIRKDIRQENPLSPMLFILVADVFDRMLWKAIREKMVRGVGSSCCASDMRCFKFTDDTLVQNGGLTSFWHDGWASDVALWKQLLNLYLFSNKTTGLIAKHLVSDQWERQFRCPFNYRAANELSMLRHFIANLNLQPRQDCRSWKWHSSQTYTTKLGYQFFINGGIILFFSKIIWKCVISEKVKIFNWLCYHQRVLTADILVKKDVQGPSQCPLCLFQMENINHLLFGCVFSRKIWSSLLWGLSDQTLPASLNDLWHDVWRNNPRNRNMISALDFLIAVGCWCIWKERNRCVFQFIAHADLVVFKTTASLFIEWTSSLCCCFVSMLARDLRCRLHNADY